MFVSFINNKFIMNILNSVKTPTCKTDIIQVWSNNVSNKSTRLRSVDM